MNREDARRLMSKLNEYPEPDANDKTLELCKMLKSSFNEFGELMIEMMKGDRLIKNQGIQPIMPEIVGTLLAGYLMRGTDTIDEAMHTARQLSDTLIQRIELCDQVLNKDGTKQR